MDKKERNPGFSLRSWARSLGLKGHTPLHLMIAGKRAIPKKYVPVLIENLQLTSREGMYFETLVDLERAKDAAKRAHYLERLKELSPKPPSRTQELDSFSILRDPLHAFLIEMTELRGFKRDPKWIAAQARFHVTPSQVEQALARLVEAGLLREDEQGALRKTHQHLTSRPDCKELALRDYHRKVSRLAADAVGTLPAPQREYNGWCFGLRKASLPLAKQMIRDFSRQLMEAVEAAPGEAEEIHQLNVQLFPVIRGAKP